MKTSLIRSAEQPWSPQEQPQLPWYPDWTVYAACRGKFGKPRSPQDEHYDPFFDYSAESEETRRAKRTCYGCPVRLQCLKENLWVPFGIWGGYTERERRKLRGDRRDRSVQVGFFREFEPARGRDSARREAG